ncbi:hypothetical protein NCS52_01082800 [Fusarium sp. LHS14.1]|nr:hypothetical protein NCS52_01082800 [Fusarium sp. LHS14.1]
MLDDVQNGIGIRGPGPVSGATGEMLLERAAQRLEKINNELQLFVEHCGKESKNSIVKAKKRKWIMQSDKLQKLREKAMDAKMNLHFTLTAQSRGLMCEQVSSLQHQFEMFTQHMSSRRSSRSSTLIESSDSPDEEKAEEPEIEAVEPASSLESPTQAQINRCDEDESSTCFTASQLQPITPMRRTKCSHLCRCRCHSSQRRSRRTNWAIPFLGSLLVDYRSASGTRQAGCSDDHCSSTTETVFEFKYYSPSWLWEGMVSFWASYHKTAGLRVALRPNRVLPWRELVMSFIRSPFDNFRDAISLGIIRVYPDDEVTVHCSIIEQDLDISLIRQALEDEPWAVNECNSVGRTPLELAISQRWDAADVVELLIAMGADVNQMPIRWGRTPLMIAAEMGEYECIRILSRLKGILEATDWAGNTALHRAAMFTQLKSVQLLLNAGSQRTARNLDGDTPLHFLGTNHIQDEQAAQEILHLLIRNQDAAIETRNYCGRTPVLVAVINQRLSTVRLLVSEGAYLHGIYDRGRTSLHHAASRLSLQLLQYLDSLNLSGIDLNHPDHYGRTPWDIFQFVLFKPLADLKSCRRPSIDEQQAFVSLYEGIRNRTAKQDIIRLEKALRALSQRKITTALSLLHTLVEEKQKWASGLHKWYRIVIGQPREGDLEAGVGSIEDYVDELQDLIQSSAWELPSIFTPRPDPEYYHQLETE